MTEVSILYGPGEKRFEIPERNLLTVAKPRPLPPVPDVATEVKRAIYDPIGGNKLSDFVKPTSKVAIFIDDPTRPTPGKKILPTILGELEKLGVPKQNIRIIIGCGGHYAGGLFFLNEVIMKIGPEIAARYEWLVHEPADETRLRFLGNTSYGTPVYINKFVADADVKIGVGSIFVHRIAGYGGGAKMVLPGVAGEKSVMNNHFNVALSDRGDPCMIGTIENPVRLDMEEAANILVVDMMVNLVMNGATNEVIKIYAGDIVKSHRAGIDTYNKMYQTPMKTADASIVSSNHLWLSLGHGLKAICVADMACKVTREGGPIAIVSPFPRDREKMLPGEERYDAIVRHIQMPPEKIVESLLKGEFRGRVVSSGSMMASYSLTRKRHPILIMSDGWSHDQANPLTYEYVPNVDKTVRRILEIAGEDAQINVIDMGNAMVPKVM